MIDYPVCNLNALTQSQTCVCYVDVGKREPPYSSVTARESLANMRVREAQEMRDLHPTDRTYETVDYDTIVVSNFLKYFTL